MRARRVGGPAGCRKAAKRCTARNWTVGPTLKIVIAICLIALLSIAASAQVPYKRIAAADGEPSSWLTYSGNYQAQRYSALTQVNRQNVTQLKPAWVYQMRNAGIVETTPIVADGVMYITEPPSTVTALDVRTGRPLWTYTPNIPPDVIIIGSPPVNRGVAVLDDLVYLATVHTHLIALDRRSGAVRWDAVVDDNKQGYYMTLAPLAINGKIIIGISGAETGIRGFIDAYDAKTGKRVWRTHTVPAPGEPGSETWGGDSWKNGGGSTWVTGAFDPALNLVYWGTGNPGPDWNGDVRPGDNLYTCALLAMDADTGKIKWHFQFTPHDVHDWDATEVPVLFDATINGRARKLVAMANRNAFYYVLDRENGQFLSATQYVKQTWSDGIDDKGRPKVRPGTDPSIEGTLVFPDITGGANWYSPSYSPQTKLFYHTAREVATTYYKGEADYKPGTAFTAGGGRRMDGDVAFASVKAWEATTGKPRWEFKLLTPPMAGLLSTAGGLVFGGTEEGNFFALDAENGKPLWDLQLGAAIRSNPMSFAVDGKQYVAIPAGSALFVFGL
jgi:alcohol dehydrogenase (cytochrome c)